MAKEGRQFSWATQRIAELEQEVDRVRRRHKVSQHDRVLDLRWHACCVWVVCIPAAQPIVVHIHADDNHS